MQERMTTKTGSRDRESHQKYAQRLPSCPAALEFLHGGFDAISTSTHKLTRIIHGDAVGCVRMILPQVHLRKPCYDFSFL